VKRVLAVLAALVIVVVLVWWFLVRDKTVSATVRLPQPVAAIGAGEGALAVTGDGKVVLFMPVPADPPLPTLPLDKPPKGGHLKGPAREQTEVLAATPAALRRFVASSSYGESGVVLELTSGIELIFGDSSQAARKWKAGAAVLADPSISALDYVDLRAPSRPSYGGEGHVLPP
jgi:cell division septal protein FtsQ